VAQVVQRPPVGVEIHRFGAGQGTVQILDAHAHQFVQHVMPVHPEIQQSACGVPRFDRVTVPQLVRDHLVQRHVHSRVDPVDLPFPRRILQGTAVFRMFSLDQDAALVGVGGGEPAEFRAAEAGAAVGHGEQPLVQGVLHFRLGQHRRKVTEVSRRIEFGPGRR
jgi:hypothetical protein